MKDLISLLRRFLPPYKKAVVLNVLFNILCAITSVSTFVALVPILQILFQVDSTVYEFKPWNGLDTDVLKNNIYWFIYNTTNIKGALYTLVLLSVYLIGMTILRTLTMYLSAHYMVNLRTGVVRDIRKQINDKILTLPLSFFSNEQKGDIMARMTGDVNEVENSVMSSLDMITKNPIVILIYMATLLYLSWKLTLFVLILLPVSGYIMGKIGKKLKRQSQEAQSMWGGLMSQMEEVLGGLRIIKAFNAEKKIKDRFDSLSEAYRKKTAHIGYRQQLAHPISELLGTITIALILWYGGMLILSDSNSINAGEFIYYLTIFYLIINPAKDLSKSMYVVQRGLASMERIDKILQADNPIVDPTNPKTISFQKSVSYRNVWFKYENEWVLKDVTLVLPKGKTVALVGQSGSGKSTMADLLPRFYDVTKGGIYIDDVNVKDLKIADLRGLMGNVNQEAILFNDTIFNNIAFGVDNATKDQVVEAAKVANAHQFIMEMENGYESNIGDRGGKLSGGQRQRISIARAILKNPEILILDEATSALDTESEKLVQDALSNLMKNRTTLVIAHRLSTIKNADEICVMYEGEIVERGKHQELYQNDGIYRKLCDMQQF